MNKHYQTQSFIDFQPSALNSIEFNASKTISKLENDHELARRRWLREKESLTIQLHAKAEENRKLQQSMADIIEQYQSKIESSETKRKQNESKYRHKQKQLELQIINLQAMISTNHKKYQENMKINDTKFNELQVMYNRHRSDWELKERKYQQQMNAITDAYSKIVKDRDELRNEMRMLVNSGDNEPEQCCIRFEKWLKDTVKLGQYIMKFRKAEYNDIRLVQGFDDEILRNEVGIYKSLHIKLILSEAQRFMIKANEFLKWLNLNDLSLYQDKLRYHGICTMDDLYSVQSREQLMEILNENDVEHIWTRIHGEHTQNIMMKMRMKPQFDDMDEEDEEKQEIYETPGDDMDIDMDVMDMDGQMSMLQYELENYRMDYMEQQCKKKGRGRRRKSMGFVIEPLQIFYDMRAIVVRKWMSLRHQQYQNLLDKLLDKHMNNSLSNRLFDIYPILFNLIIGCYNIIQREYKLMVLQDPISINLVFLNMERLYNASKNLYCNNE